MGRRKAAVLPLLFLSVALALLAACAPKQTQTPPAKSLFTSFLVEADWLNANLSAPELALIDLRAAADYRQGHIPGAVNLSMAQITDPRNPVRGMLAPRAEMESIMRGLGVSQDSLVAIYDDGGAPGPGRLFWALHYYGMERIAVLNGGYAGWRKQGLPTDTAAATKAAGNYTATPNPSRSADKDYVKRSIGKAGTVILDVRSPAEYEGSVKSAQRGGHIPGAINVDWTNNLATVDGVARLKPADELRRLYEGLGITRDKEVIVHCQTGVRAGQTYFTLRYLGYGQVRLYDGSWEEWGNDASLPVAVGKGSDAPMR
ncbi:MAG: sulfurtransferase [Chloroflexi bacterium]|nr:sulfurtransferase [Chloroflexota bacterium]